LGRAETREWELIKLVANCVRCVSLNVDLKTGTQANGDVGEVLKTLMKDRRVDTRNQ